MKIHVFCSSCCIVLVHSPLDCQVFIIQWSQSSNNQEHICVPKMNAFPYWTDRIKWITRLPNNVKCFGVMISDIMCTFVILCNENCMIYLSKQPIGWNSIVLSVRLKVLSNWFWISEAETSLSPISDANIVNRFIYYLNIKWKFYLQIDYSNRWISIHTFFALIAQQVKIV